MTKNKDRFYVFTLSSSLKQKLVYSSVYKDRAFASYLSLKRLRMPCCLMVVNRFDDSDARTLRCAYAPRDLFEIL